MEKKDKLTKIILILEDMSKILFQMSQSIGNMAKFFKQEFLKELEKGGGNNGKEEKRLQP